MIITRENTRKIQIGNKTIGGGSPILIQSMTNTKTQDVESTVRQILELEEAGCDIIRCAVPTIEAAEALSAIKKSIHIPLVADIHFDYRLALAAIENGADKIRINPGNLGSDDRLQAVVSKAKERNIPIRVGVNSGSLEKEKIEKYGGHVTAEGIVESALDKVKRIEELDYNNLVISIKSSNVMLAVKAHELLELVGLDRYADFPAGSLAYGQQRLVEIARALSSDPKLILLDEPAAGMNSKEKADLNEMIRKIIQRGTTVLLVEHDMSLVMNIADKIYVLSSGQNLAEGTPKEVAENPAVIEAYLGKGDI